MYHASENSQHKNRRQLLRRLVVKWNHPFHEMWHHRAGIHRLPIEATATAWFSLNIVMFRTEVYISITWYGELEQAALLAELLFESTEAGCAGQEKCSLWRWRSDWNDGKWSWFWASCWNSTRYSSRTQGVFAVGHWLVRWKENKQWWEVCSFKF